MNREEAERALGIIRKVIEETRDDLVARGWGRIWMAHAFTNGLTFAAIGWFVAPRGLSIPWLLAPLAACGAVNVLLILALARRDQGIRSFVEWQLHGIWTTFIASSSAAAAGLHLSGAQPSLLGPVLALTSGIGFAMMGVVFYRRFLAYGVVFLALTVATPLAPEVQWYLLGAAWWVALFVPGLDMDRERRRRDRDGRGTEIL